MSSPLSHWSSSPVSPKSTTKDVLMPSCRVKALLAPFDDSDSEQELNRPAQNDTALLAPTINPAHRDPAQCSASNGEEEDDALPLAPRGRLAARLQAARPNSPGKASDGNENGKAYQRVKEQWQLAKRNATKPDAADGHNVAEISEDELSMLAPRRRLLKRKSSPVPSPEHLWSRARSDSPRFFPSPSATRKSLALSPSNHQSDSDDLPENPVAGGNAKFLALVEKHRKQRHAKEAAEVAKKAARAEQLNEHHSQPSRPRGSSPGDGSEEDSDVSNIGARKGLTQEARPARKAGKRALEEMNRETQRMSRNMQLAHQAKTRKKITKESLLARFNFPRPGATSIGQLQDGNSKSTTASSAPTSDVEAAKEHVTPPTSPLQDDGPEKSTTRQYESAMEIDYKVMSMSMRDEELLSLEEVLTQSASKVDKGNEKVVETFTQPMAVLPPKKAVRPIRVKWSKQDAVIARAADSDSDLEIITSQSKTRKYAAFENLPKRNAREKQSHLMLRGLAHIVGSEDRKRLSMNTAEMEISLRKAAREQARRERQEKIEELKAKGVVIQTAEERERDQQEVENIVERARQEAADIQKREKELAKKDGTYVKDGLGDDSDDEDDADFEDEEGDQEAAVESGSDEQENDEVETGDEEEDEDDGGAELVNEDGNLIDQEADEQDSDQESEGEEEETVSDLIDEEEEDGSSKAVSRKSRTARVVLSDDEDDEQQEDTSPGLPAPAKTPQSLPRSARKMIPGLQMSDDLPMRLTQAFAATMAGSQTQDDTPETQEQDTLSLVRDLPSPMIPFAPRLNRLDSIDVVSDSQPASQTQPLNVNLSLSQPQRIPQSPIGLAIFGPQFTPSQLPFEPTQDAGYMLSPFAGSRFDAETPRRQGPNSTIDTVILPNDVEESPVMQRMGRLRRGRAQSGENDEAVAADQDQSAFAIMKRAAKQKATEPVFDKTKSAAKDIIDEAAEESEDEYAGLGGASDDEAGEENEDDRRMIDEDTQVGRGDEAKLAGLFADRERKQDEAAVSKLLKDITTGALRRKRGVADDLDLSDEEDAAARRRETKRREFAKMRRELLKDEAVGKIAEDLKKEAFLRSIEDRDEDDDEDLDFDGQETPVDESQSQLLQAEISDETQDLMVPDSQDDSKAGQKRKRPLQATTESAVNRLPPALRRTAASVPVNKRPATLAEIRETVSFLIEEPDSQSAMIDLGLSDSDDEPEAYVNLDRHLNDADENDDAEDLGDFIIDDDGQAEIFKKPELPRRNSDRPNFSERRTKPRGNVVDRLQLIRQASSSSASSHGSGSAKMAFFTNKNSSTDSVFNKVPNLLRRATSNSSFGSMAGRGEEVSATGVVTGGNRTERGGVEQEKEFVRKGNGGRRNAVNFRAKEKPENIMSRNSGVVKKGATKGKAGKSGASGFLGGLFRGDSWN